MTVFCKRKQASKAYALQQEEPSSSDQDSEDEGAYMGEEQRSINNLKRNECKFTCVKQNYFHNHNREYHMQPNHNNENRGEATRSQKKQLDENFFFKFFFLEFEPTNGYKNSRKNGL